jgi:hypothetical protein
MSGSCIAVVDRSEQKPLRTRGKIVARVGLAAGA